MRAGRLVLLVASVALLGCEEARDRAAANVVERVLERNGRETRIEIDRRDRSITVHLGGAIVPEGWPKDVPVPESARRLRIEKSTAERAVLSVAAEEDVDELARWYGRELRAGGWSVEETDDGGLRAGRDDRRLVAAFSRQGNRSRGRIEVVPGIEEGG